MTKTNQFRLQTAVMVVVVFLFTGGGLALAGNGNKFVPGELLVQMKPGVSKDKAKGLLTSHGAATAGEIETLKIQRIKVPGHALEKVRAALAKNPNVSFVEKNFIADAGLAPDDPRYASQWHLPKISAPQGWDMETGAQSVPIAIIDSGVDPDHPDLAGKLIDGYNFVAGNTDTRDVQGHGTAVAGAAAALSNNTTGVAGVSWGSPIMPLLVLNPDNYATYYNIARAITYAADNGVRIMNISIGGSSSSSTLQGLQPLFSRPTRL